MPGWRAGGARPHQTGQPPEPRLQPGVPVDFVDLDEAVRAGVFDVGLRPTGPGTWIAIYRDDSSLAPEVVRHVQELCAAANAEDLRAALVKTGQRPPPRTQVVAAPIAMASSGRLSLAVFVPLVLILMTITGAVYPAIDLTAGERERGTLELLIAAPVPRVTLLLAKYIAVVVVAVLTALVNLGSMTVSLLIGGLANQVFGPGGIRLATLVEVFGIVLLFAAFFAAVLLVITSFARSFKEAQAYLIPLMVVALVPGIAGLLPGLHLSGPLAVVPLLNIVLLRTTSSADGPTGSARWWSSSPPRPMRCWPWPWRPVFSARKASSMATRGGGGHSCAAKGKASGSQGLPYPGLARRTDSGTSADQAASNSHSSVCACVCTIRHSGTGRALATDLRSRPASVRTTCYICCADRMAREPMVLSEFDQAGTTEEGQWVAGTRTWTFAGSGLQCSAP